MEDSDWTNFAKEGRTWRVRFREGGLRDLQELLVRNGETPYWRTIPRRAYRYGDTYERILQGVTKRSVRCPDPEPNVEWSAPAKVEPRAMLDRVPAHVRAAE